MSEHDLSKSNKVPIDREMDTKPKKRTVTKPLITSEIEYSQGTSYPSSNSDTKDSATEAYVETDNIYITTEIYSMTDIPSSLTRNRNAPPKPGMVIPEYCDDKCLVLRAYRDKSINTDGSYDYSEPCLSLNCIFPPENFTRRSGCYKKEIERYCEPAMGTCVRVKWSMCKDTCANLVTSETSQTDGDCTVAPELTVNIVKDASISMNQAKGKHKPGIPKNLMTIQEEESKTKDEEVGEQMKAEESSSEKEIVKREAEELVKSEIQEEPDIDNMEKIRKMKDQKDVAVDISETASEATIASEMLSYKDEIIVTSLKRDKVSRKWSPCKIEMGTIITSQSATWMDRPRRRNDCRGYSASRESFCRSSRISDSFVCCTRLVRPTTNHSTVQCDIIRNDARTKYPSIDPSISCEYFERCTPCARHFDNRTRSVQPNSGWSGSNEICSMDYWSSKNNPTYGSMQEAFIRRPLYGVNNIQRCPIAREPLESRNNAYNQNYVNLNKGYYNGFGGYCLCNGGYNARNANAFYGAPRNQMVYHTPVNYCHFASSWY